MLASLRKRFRNFLEYWAAWALAKSSSKNAKKALFSLAFIESIFFPIPPDVLLVSMSAADNKKALNFAFIATVGSVLGAVIGYAIGYFLYDSVGKVMVDAMHLGESFQTAGTLFQKYDFLIIFAAAFTPIPYKVFTLAAGLWHINLVAFILASVVGRGARFYLQGFLFYFYGSQVRGFISKYIELISLVVFIVVALLVLYVL